MLRKNDVKNSLKAAGEELMKIVPEKKEESKKATESGSLEKSPTGEKKVPASKKKASKTQKEKAEGKGAGKKPAEEKVYLILAKRHGLALSAAESVCEDGTEVCMAEINGQPEQLWKLAVEGKFVKIICQASGKALDVIAQGTENGAWVHLWESVDAESQLWTLEKKRGGSCRIKSKLSGKYLDIVGISDDPGANVQIWEEADGDNQIWRLKEVKEKK